MSPEVNNFMRPHRRAIGMRRITLRGKRAGEPDVYA